MFIEFTTVIGCTNKCVFCPQATLSKAYFSRNKSKYTRLLSLTNFIKMVDKLPQEMEIFLSGMSEPFQNPYCLKMAQYALKSGHNLNICSTLIGLSSDKLKQLLRTIKTTKQRCKFMIHLPSEGKFERIPVTPMYEETLKILLQTDGYLEFHYHYDELNHKVSKIMKRSKYKPTLMRITNRTGHVKLDVVDAPRRSRGIIACSRRKEHGFVVLPDGTVIFCCQDWGMKHVLGNLLTSDYETIYKSRANKIIDKGLKDESLDILCRTCDQTINVNARAQFYNTKFSLKKILLGTKMIAYNNFKPIYRYLWSIKNAVKKQDMKDPQVVDKFFEN